MSISVEEFDTMSFEEAFETMRDCCGSTTWVNDMVSRRPFGEFDVLIAAADDAWAKTTEKDWLEAFEHHPRIGDTGTTATQSAAAKSWSSHEQAGVKPASSALQEELAAVNAAYERKFGHIYVVCAAGKDVTEMLDMAKARMTNDHSTELRVSAEEQRKIMQLRLRKLFGIVA